MVEPIQNADENVSREVARILLDTESILISPASPFTLTSGRKSPVYVDCRQLISFPGERGYIMDCAASMLSNLIGDDNIDILAGGETAGIPYAAMIAERINKPMIYVRKKPKGFGRTAQIEGAINGKSPKAVLIEDLQTDGGSKEVFINALRNAGIQVSFAFVIFHYGIFQSSIDNMKALDLKLCSLATWKDVVALAEAENRISPEDIKSLKAFLDNPENWDPAQIPQTS